ncbi:MAG: hypothetical protein GY870_06680 [archaeon]|nr:hypothetical protein [archaeon]
MINLEIEIDGEVKEFKVPQGWNEVTVKQTSKIASIDRGGINNLELMIEILSILGNVDKEICYMMQQEDFINIIETLKFTNEEIKSELKDSIVLGGEEYLLKKDFDKLTMGEIISIETIIKEYDNNIQLALPKLLCIFLRKKLENGKLESFKNDFMEREELFGEAIITDVNDIFLFFLDGKDL